MLKVIMSIYDPLGLLGYYVIRGKVLLQNIWRSELDWDNKITNSIEKRWSVWLQELEKVRKLWIPRCYCKGKYYSIELHVFCDTSEQAFGAVAYFRFENEDNVKISLVMSKTQVCPLRPITIPRLELQAALIACRVAETIKKQHNVVVRKTFLWTDSKTVLSWLKSEAQNFKTFVAHRVGEIQAKSEVKDRYWVPTKDNVADELTRNGK